MIEVNRSRAQCNKHKEEPKAAWLLSLQRDDRVFALQGGYYEVHIVHARW